MSSDEHRQASLAGDPRNAAIISPRSRKPGLGRASMPPASNKLLAKFARGPKSETVPRHARNILGRAPVRESIASEASRKASNGSAGPTGRRGAAGGGNGFVGVRGAAG